MISPGRLRRSVRAPPRRRRWTPSRVAWRCRCRAAAPYACSGRPSCSLQCRRCARHATWAAGVCPSGSEHRRRPRHHRAARGAVRPSGQVRGHRLQPDLQLRQVLSRGGRGRFMLPVLHQLPPPQRPLRQAVRMPARRPSVLRAAGTLLRAERDVLQGLGLPSGLQARRAAVRGRLLSQGNRVRDVAAARQPRPADVHAEVSPRQDALWGQLLHQEGLEVHRRAALPGAPRATSGQKPCGRKCCARGSTCCDPTDRGSAARTARPARDTAARRSAARRARKRVRDHVEAAAIRSAARRARRARRSPTGPARCRRGTGASTRAVRATARCRSAAASSPSAARTDTARSAAGSSCRPVAAAGCAAARTSCAGTPAAARTPTPASIRHAVTAGASRSISTPRTAAGAADAAVPAPCAARAAA